MNDSAVRQACSVFLKNRVVRAWHVDSATTRVDAAPIPQSDRAFIKSHILALLVAAGTRPLRVQIASSLKIVITHDFPTEWPTLLNEILALLTSGDQRSIYGGCFGLLELVKSMRSFNTNSQRPDFTKIYIIVDSASRTTTCHKLPKSLSRPWWNWALTLLTT